MSSKRLSPKPSATADDWKITDEWGIYDPAKAGMPALFARLGRPILQAPASSSRRERRRALRPERTSDGVGLALAEARRRAGLDSGVNESTEPPLVGNNPARAMRLALRAQAAVNAMGTPHAEPFIPLDVPALPAPVSTPVPEPVPAPVQAQHLEPADVPAVPAPKKRATRKASARTAAVPATSAEPAAAKTRTRKAAAGKGRARQAAPAIEAAPLAVAAPTHEPPSAKPHLPPAPSPRRPRGPVPLAAWARAVADPPKPEPRRADPRGFWRGIFRMPAEVALVEYAHGARIHRLLIETSDDLMPDFI